MASLLPICAQCGFTTKKAHRTDDGILCPRCFSAYREDRSELLIDDGWCY